jgi:hypothetical protein
LYNPAIKRAYESLTPEQFNAEIEKGLADLFIGDAVDR